MRSPKRGFKVCGPDSMMNFIGIEMTNIRRSLFVPALRLDLVKEMKSRQVKVDKLENKFVVDNTVATKKCADNINCAFSFRRCCAVLDSYIQRIFTHAAPLFH
jgi:hypothetical protein